MPHAAVFVQLATLQSRVSYSIFPWGGEMYMCAKSACVQRVHVCNGAPISLIKKLDIFKDKTGP